MTFPSPAEAQETSNTDTNAPQLRQRRSDGFPATEKEKQHANGGSSKPLFRAQRRRSSFMTDDSSSAENRRTSRSSLLNRRGSYQTSSESLLSPPRATSNNEHIHEEPSLWYSAPLLFAIVPAIGGVAFKKGSILLTDIALLALAAVYLNWCLVTPWIWYHSAQTIRIAKPPMEGPISEQAIQDDLDDVANDRGVPVPSSGDYPDEADASPPPADPAKVNPAAGVSDRSSPTREASTELALHEFTALAFCILGPLFGSSILHFIRSSLTSLHGGQLVSNLHLTLFVLGAELRPVRHCIKLVQARTLHLQRVVRSDPHGGFERQAADQAALAEISQRLAELETTAITSADQQQAVKPEPSASPEDIRRTQQALQTQIDALNRAVRRYEKRETARLVQNEERLQDIESRLRDALSLAAAAAQYSQKPGLAMGLLAWTAGSIRWTISVFTGPLVWANKVTWDMLTRLGLAKPTKKRLARADERAGKADGFRERRDRVLARKRDEGLPRYIDGGLRVRR